MKTVEQQEQEAKQKVKLISITPEVELNIVRIARVSSKRTDKDVEPAGLINYLIRNKHWSPFEHGYITMEIKTSRAIGTQLLRHRSFTFQEFSQRYAKVTSVEPIELRRQATDNRQSSEEVFDPMIQAGSSQMKASKAVDHIVAAIQVYYESLLEAGVAKECARMILPMATSTTIYMTGNIRSWIHFLQLRDEAHSQKEAQVIAKQIKAILTEQLPITNKALNYGNEQK